MLKSIAKIWLGILIVCALFFIFVSRTASARCCPGPCCPAYSKSLHKYVIRNSVKQTKAANVSVEKRIAVISKNIPRRPHHGHEKHEK